MNTASHPPAPDLTRPQRETLQAVLQMLVPPSADGRMPGAADLPQVLQQIEHAVAALPALREGLDLLQQEAMARHGAGFVVLDQASRAALLDEFAARQPAVLQRLGLEAVTCYYQQDAVLERLGLEARPPYPVGFKVPAGDLSLLGPVVARGRIWRDAP